MTIEPPSLTIEVGSVGRLRSTGRTAAGKAVEPAVQWSSGDQLVATVSLTGEVTGLTAGQTLVSAQSGNLRASASVTVIPPVVASVSVDPADTSLFPGASAQLRAVLRDSRGAILPGRPVDWTTSDPAVATVSSTGIVTAIRPGTATMTATNEGRSGSARVVVRELPVARVEIQPDSVSLAVGSTLSPQVVLRDSLGRELTQPVAWSTLDPTIAGVSPTGVVTGQAPGRTRIIASSGGATGSAFLAVHAASIAQIQLSSSALSLLLGEERVVTATALDAQGQAIPDVVVSWKTAATGGGLSSAQLQDNPSSNLVIRPMELGVSSWTASAEGRESKLWVFATSPTSGSLTTFLGRCPTAAEIAFATAAVHTLDFQGDPGGPPVCQVAQSGASLTQLQSRTYLAILMLASLRFADPLPWTSGSLFDWFSREIQGIRFRADVSVSFCCIPPGVINIQTVNLGLASFPRFTAPDAGIALALFIHETRHISYGGHTCGTKDNTIAELGAWGVQYHFYRLMGTALVGDGLTTEEKNAFTTFADQIRQVSFCTPGGTAPQSDLETSAIGMSGLR